ncbi:MAG: arabinosyltransferase, partial [Mycobacterium sp.]|nr:arabinosyltransferase [Mycobacterium sp.]
MGNHRNARLVAIVAGLLGALLALATPFLPVTQTTAQLNWPQNGVMQSVDAPLIGYVATDLNVSIPCRAAAGLVGAENASRTVLLSTVPKQAPKAVDRGLLIERVGGDLLVIVRNTPVVTAPLTQVLSPACQQLKFTAHADKVTGEFVGLVEGPDAEGAAKPGDPLRGERSGYDFRPQIVGVFTDLSGPAPPGLRFSATIDSRYSTSPTVLKTLAMIVGIAMTVIALGALHVLDTADGVRHRRFLPRRWWSLSVLDGVVAAVLVWWHFVGANTSDDGYILTMARVSEHAGYMANYYRWFGTPEAPFGWYYDLLALWAHVSTASVWVRLPTLVMALACWWVISREVIPRLGHAVKNSKAAAWTAAGMFLAFWLPLNNGLRPEPIIALGMLLTWCSVERGVATSRLLPVAIAIIIGALTLFSGPTGIAAVGALLVAIGPLKTIVAAHTSRFGYLALLAPILAAGTVTIFLIFRDQTLTSEVQASAFKSAVGPSLAWFDEHIRYERLFMASPDGSVARRFAVLALLLALAVSVAMSLRKGRIPGTASGPSRRIIGITIISFLAMMFTPTKWTHHFGVFAGLAGSLGALAAVAVAAAAMKSRRNRTIFAATVLFMTAFSFASVNGWWYVSNFGVPWSNQFPQYKFGFTTILLGLSVVALLVAAWFHFTGRGSTPPSKPRRWSRVAQAPLTIAVWALVAFEVFSLTAAMIGQYPAWTVGRSNLEAVTGKTCGLATDVMVEQDPNAGTLLPVSAPVGVALGDTLAQGFSPNGIPADVSADPVSEPQGSNNFADSDGSVVSGSEPGTEGGTTAAAGVNGSRARLPYN